MLRPQDKFKKGATSIYVVVIATLLFSVITVSFIRIIINETSKTTGDELAQSAYDSALAGIEDTKTALKKYYECIAAENNENECKRIRDNIDAGFTASDNTSATTVNCDSISKALGRIGEHDETEVKIAEKSTPSESIVQAYTCITIDDTLEDYRATMSSGSTIAVIPLKTKNPEYITGINIRWYTKEDNNGDFNVNRLNYANNDASGNNFDKKTVDPTPPTLSAQVIQTAGKFTLDQFKNSEGNNTNRGTTFLVPSNNSGSTHLAQSVLRDSNNHDYNRNGSNQPQKVRCESNEAGITDEFACSMSLELPDPIPASGEAKRNAETFFLVLTLPYGGPTTTYSIQLCDDGSGGNPAHADTGGTRGNCLIDSNKTPAIAEFKGAQIAVDATGRANDMYSRVEARIEFRDIYFPYPEFAIQATGSDAEAIKKNFYVTDSCLNTTAGDGSVNNNCSDTGDNGN